MCGIWAYLLHQHVDLEYDKVLNNFMNIKGRGPDSMKLIHNKNKYMLGFHRLSIMDVSTKGNQPFEYFDESTNTKYTCVCNGEIYNASDIKSTLENEFNFTSSSDCEVLIPLYIKFKTEMVNKLDGVFSIIIIIEKDNNIEYFVVRDRIGVRPLYIGRDNFKNFIFSSELKGMKDIAISSRQFTPGTYKLISFSENNYNERTETYYNIKKYLQIDKFNSDQINLYNKICNTLTETVKKRLISDRPVCALLSGGLDSSLVCSIASKLLKDTNQKLYTFSIGIPGSTDVKYAKMVSEYIGSEHTVVNITPEDAIAAIKDVILATETYDITTVRASTGQYLVSKYIAENTNFKVILSGDGSDEVTNGYLENYMAPNLEELHKHAIKRLSEIHYYDVQRADRATSIHGLELRVPFLDVSFVDLYLNIDPKFKMPDSNNCEKKLLRDSFINNYLPKEVLWRQKEAFSDGISSQENSWHSIIQKLCDEKITDDELLNAKEKYSYCTPTTKEAYYFRSIFDELYGDKFSNVIPGFWMPEWSNATDPSARTLNIYSNKEDINNNCKQNYI